MKQSNNQSKGDNTPTNTLEDIEAILYRLLYAANILYKEDPTTGELSNDAVEQAKQKIEALISQAVNKAQGCIDCGKKRCENCERLWQT